MVVITSDYYIVLLNKTWNNENICIRYSMKTGNINTSLSYIHRKKRKKYAKEYYNKHKKEIHKVRKKWYNKNPSKVKKYWKNRDEKHRIIIHELKVNGCAICGYNKCDNALSFHHVNPLDKKFQITYRALSYTTERFINEINKCILLCANCHREIHEKDRNYDKYIKNDYINLYKPKDGEK